MVGLAIAEADGEYTDQRAALMGYWFVHPRFIEFRHLFTVSIRSATRVAVRGAQIECEAGRVGAMQRILVVEDERVEVDVVSFLLRRSGWEPAAATDAAAARRLFEELHPDLVILDIHLGDADGRDLLREFRKQRPDVPILMLTALSAEDERVRGFELGADDYLCKPFSHREFVARVRALLRRGTHEVHEPVEPARMQLGSVVLDPMTHEVTRWGQPVSLTPTEFRLLQTLMSRPNTLVPLRKVLKEVWGHQDLSAKNVVRVAASRLRAKLGDTDVASPLVQTIRGEGLKFCVDNPQASASLHAPTDGPVAVEVIADLQDLLEETGIEPLGELNQAFLRTAEGHISAMRDALARRDADVLVEQAHRLRGVSATLGAQRLSRVCAEIETGSRAGDLTQVDDLLRRVESELLEFENALSPLIARIS